MSKMALSTVIKELERRRDYITNRLENSNILQEHVRAELSERLALTIAISIVSKYRESRLSVNSTEGEE